MWAGSASNGLALLEFDTTLARLYEVDTFLALLIDNTKSDAIVEGLQYGLLSTRESLPNVRRPAGMSPSACPLRFQKGLVQLCCLWTNSKPPPPSEAKELIYKGC